jgi:hypothetical protein
MGKGGEDVAMHDELNELLALMNRAREEADQANGLAYGLRQDAIKAQFGATAAADTTALTAELLSQCTDPKMMIKLARASREAILKTIEATEKAADSVIKANEADLLVTKAFGLCREAAHKLSIALDTVENMNGYPESAASSIEVAM